jgi:hypothetical protein
VALFAVPAASAAEPWGYEQVSPFDKGAGAVSAIDTFTASRDGETMLYSAMGSFAEVPSVSIPLYNRYFATRGADRWYSRSLELPYDIPPEGVGTSAQFAIMITLRASVNLKYSLVISARALLPGAIQGGSNLYMQENATGDLKLVAARADNTWVANSLTHLGQTSYFWVGPNGDEALFNVTKETEGVPPGMVKWTEEGGLESAVFDEAGNPTDETAAPSANDEGMYEPMPAEGALNTLYTSMGEITPVYKMEDEKAVPISVSQRAGEEGTVKPGQIHSIAGGGRYAFFSSVGALTDDAPETVEGNPARVIYRYDDNTGDLTYIGHGSYRLPTVIQGTEDGQTLAFATTEALLPGDTTAPENSKNLYVWRNGTLKLVYQAEAGSFFGQSTVTSALHVLSRNGRYLYFTDNSKDLAAEFGTETESLACARANEPDVPRSCSQVYVYDADQGAGGELECASCTEGTAVGHNGDPGTGNGAIARFNNHPPQYVSTDGRAFFGTYTAFDPDDDNGMLDVYEFHEGEYRLVSGAAQGYGARFIDASDDGKTVYFTTAAKLVPQDSDRASDLYVTREGAGFPYKPAETTPPCLALESCHGPIPGVTPAPAPSTSAFEGRPDAPIVNGKVAVTKAAVRGEATTVTVRVSGPGKVTAAGAGLVKVSKRTKKAGPVTLTVRLTGKSKAALKQKGELKRTVRVAFEPDEGRGASASRALAFKAPAGKGGR